MITTIKRNAAILIGIGVQTAAMASVADSFTIPQPDNGASAIWSRGNTTVSMSPP